MRTLPLSEAKTKLGRIIESLCLTDEEVMITKNGRSAAILISPNEFESWRETVAILSDRDLMSEIRKGLSDLKKNSRLYSVDELFE
ncbi:MAG TPA: type II toxin-antitoxin system Phd/YefM family antitoxin [Desulfobacteraceae bacterium]|jgi:prevent-host-death family protein|nr:type II toxin-antitoxin system Phd/YefM family antitoxin [Desulfobacteraceae bacterium]